MTEHEKNLPDTPSPESQPVITDEQVTEALNAYWGDHRGIDGWGTAAPAMRRALAAIMTPQEHLVGRDPDLLAALKGAIGALEFSRDYHKDLSNEEQAFAQDRLDAAVRAIAKAEGLAQ